MAINKVGSKGIEDGSVASADFAPNTVTSAKLQDGAVTNAKLTNTSVTLAGSSVSLGGSVSFNNKFVDWQSVITADGSTGTTAVSGRGYFIDTTSAAHTLTLPSSAAIGDFIAIKDYAGTFNTNNLTIARNGHNIQGVANDSLISTNRASLVLVYVDSTKGWLYWEEHNIADLQQNTFIEATGGTITTSGDFKIHTFTGDGCFVVSTLGLGPAGGPSNVDYLVVAGGGGGGNLFAGGGGGGGYRTTFPSPGCNAGTFPISLTTYPITVGGGGAGGSMAPPAPYRSGNSGSDSIFSTITSAGGGAGAANGGGVSGGSGGGASGLGRVGGTGNTPPVSPPQGSNGGDTAPGFQADTAGGGGGGATEAGVNATNPGGPGTGGTGIAGRGGAGASNSITGSSLSYSGGGGGGVGYNNPGPGGASINHVAGAGSPCGTGGQGGKSGCAPSYPPNLQQQQQSGTANRGGGGGGGGASPCAVMGPGGNGGKGIVIIRYKFQ